MPKLLEDGKKILLSSAQVTFEMRNLFTKKEFGKGLV